MAIFEPETKKFYCECGCGEEVPQPWQEFCKGHWQRQEKNRQRTSEVHSGKTLSQEAGFRQSEALLRFFQTEEGKAQIKRVSEGNTGVDLGEEHSSNVSEGMLLAHRVDPTIAARTAKGLLGLERSSETKKKVSQAKLRFWSSEEGLKLRERFSEKTGGNSTNWRGGYVPGGGYGWWAIREDILERDGYTCQGCGSKYSLVVHHIDGDTLNENYSNLITVCHSCNLRASRIDERDCWIEFYTNKVKESVLWN